MTREFHVSRAARDRYEFDDSLFTLTGNVILANFPATRAFAQRINERREVDRFPERAIHAGQLNAMGLIDEVLHHVIALFREQRNPRALDQALRSLDRRLGRATIDRTLRAFVEAFPTAQAYRTGLDAGAYLAGETEGVPNREIALEELLTLWLANMNPAFAPFGELFDDADLRGGTEYEAVITGLQAFFEAQQPFGPQLQTLVTMLRSPAEAVPDSLSGQLQYIRERWGMLLGGFLDRLLVGLDVLAEEERGMWLRFGGGGAGRATSPALGFGVLEGEPERFSMDRDWMPRLVLVAKSTYVWLDQLSKRYGRDIRRLDQIPDEELDTLARWGFTGLWLIGLWERSIASQRIKQLRGNPEAVASAYSLRDYRIADDLGGDPAYENLRERAWARGIRLASDMVPNHMGIDSTWVMDHPDWFISLPHPPFPAYSFTGPDVSPDGRVGLFIEDHYYDNSDAAVVFKRVDRSSGDERYIYHGNDGTSTPWNDTAQLDYARGDVREAVIQTILHVARQFPVIRFDAAMTLAKKHVQRLWFPEPGHGGAIPSRAEHGISKADFEAAMPDEFWREVVDRVATEVPDTLLLAEAFWLMEGYFVRTLGMHRVYNSAFMNMLRDEENANYRGVIKNTLEFDPEILKRYVNFMNNPDERTAVDQFGKGDKYFGICTIMATLPGLPMFGHGQIEGFGEKYGMEYRRAYHDEEPDRWLVERHEREVFPLLHRRRLFAEVRDFLLYDLVSPDGYVNEDVFAYSNRAGGERSLVVYHNRYASARGIIRTSVGYAVKTGDDGSKTSVTRTLGEGLGLPDDPTRYVLFRDAISGLEYIRNCSELVHRGLYVELEAYDCHVFTDFREVHDGPAMQYARLSERLEGRGVPSVDQSLRELQLQPVHTALRAVIDPGLLRGLLDAAWSGQPAPASLLDEMEDRAGVLMAALKEATGAEGDETSAARELRADIDAALRLPSLGAMTPTVRSKAFRLATDELATGLVDDPASSAALLGWAVVQGIGRVAGGEVAALTSRSWVDELQLGGVLAAAFRDLGLDEAVAWRTVELIKVLIMLPRISTLVPTRAPSAARLVEAWLADPDVHPYIRVNRYEGTSWFNKESFEELLWWIVALDAAAAITRSELSPAESARLIGASRELATALREAGASSGYRVDQLLAAVSTRRTAGRAGSGSRRSGRGR